MYSQPRHLATTLAALLLFAAQGTAAEIRLRRDCVPTTALVTLADVAEIHAVDAAEAEALGNVQLFAAPADGKCRYLPIRELQDLLLLRGVNLTGHTLSGASQVVVNTPAEAKPELQLADVKQPAERPLPRHERDRALEQISDEILAYLNAQGRPAPWQVEITEINADLRPFVEVSVDSPLAITGGQEPWTGTQKFEVRRTTEAGDATLTVVAEVSLPTMILATTRTLQRGSIVQASDLQFQPRRSNDTNIEVLEVPEDAIGRQVTRSIPAGGILAVSDVREPIVVRRGDAVTVYSRAPGIRVRTTARAKQDGSIGDLIEVESFNSRTTFFARASGMQEVEVFARATSLAPAAPAIAATNAPAVPAATMATDKIASDKPVVTIKSKAAVWRRSIAPKTRPAGE